VTNFTLRASAVPAHRRCSQADSHPQHGCNFTVRGMGTTAHAVKVDVDLINLVRSSELSLYRFSARSSRSDYLAPRSRGCQSSRKEKNTIPQCRKQNSGKCRKAKKENSATLRWCCSKVSSRIRPCERRRKANLSSFFGNVYRLVGWRVEGLV
jgi:hypothetical protein